MREILATVALIVPSLAAHADTITDWNAKACDIVMSANLPPPVATRVVAIAQTSVYAATNSITHRFRAARFAVQVAGHPSIEAAIAAANHKTLGALLPQQASAIDQAYQSAIERLGNAPEVAAGIATGESAAAEVLRSRLADGASAIETYRPMTVAGQYVPTAIPAVTQWPQRRPWLMTSAQQFRPGPPPALESDRWARDFNEIKALGARDSTTRTSEQTAIARFWTTTSPVIYHGIVRSVALMPGRDVTQNARLFALVSQAADDALIAVFDAKYHYNFWRPITAIRNGDADRNDATVRDASWLPFIETPMHPEYPCAHCIVAATVGTVLQLELRGSPVVLATSSPTADGATRQWSNVDDFIQEVANARICDGVHFRNSTEVAAAMGRKIGAFAVERFQ